MTSRLDPRVPGSVAPLGRGADPFFGTPEGWTDAHSEAARFIGECVALGAVFGFAVEMARSSMGWRHG